MKMGQAELFRDFGILPEGASAPAGTIRAFISGGKILGQYIGTGLVALLGLAWVGLVAWTVPTLALKLVGCLAVIVGIATLIYLATHNDYRWVELDGQTLRARHLYTGRTVERSINDIESLHAIVYNLRTLQRLVTESLLGRVKGMEVRFSDGRTPLRILRSDPAMANALPLLAAIVYRMSEIRPLEMEVVPFAGAPLLRTISWEGESPGLPVPRPRKATLAALMGLSLMFGTLLGLCGMQQQERYDVGSLPLHTISLRSLIENGPGPNRHVRLTDVRPGGYAVQRENGKWQAVWVALFPSDVPRVREQAIGVVLSSESVSDEAQLARLFEGGSVNGMCSATPKSAWGATLGPNLLKANPGCQLSSAWLIEELNHPPDRRAVARFLLGSAACFAAALVLSAMVFRISSAGYAAGFGKNRP